MDPRRSQILPVNPGHPSLPLQHQAPHPPLPPGAEFDPGLHPRVLAGLHQLGFSLGEYQKASIGERLKTLELLGRLEGWGGAGGPRSPSDESQDESSSGYSGGGGHHERSVEFDPERAMSGYREMGLAPHPPPASKPRRTTGDKSPTDRRDRESYTPIDLETLDEDAPLGPSKGSVVARQLCELLRDSVASGIFIGVYWDSKGFSYRARIRGQFNASGGRFKPARWTLRGVKKCLNDAVRSRNGLARRFGLPEICMPVSIRENINDPCASPYPLYAENDDVARSRGRGQRGRGLPAGHRGSSAPRGGSSESGGPGGLGGMSGGRGVRRQRYTGSPGYDDDDAFGLNPLSGGGELYPESPPHKVARQNELSPTSRVMAENEYTSGTPDRTGGGRYDVTPSASGSTASIEAASRKATALLLHLRRSRNDGGQCPLGIYWSKSLTRFVVQLSVHKRTYYAKCIVPLNHSWEGMKQALYAAVAERNSLAEKLDLQSYLAVESLDLFIPPPEGTPPQIEGEAGEDGESSGRASKDMSPSVRDIFKSHPFGAAALSPSVKGPEDPSDPLHIFAHRLIRAARAVSPVGGRLGARVEWDVTHFCYRSFVPETIKVQDVGLAREEDPAYKILGDESDQWRLSASFAPSSSDEEGIKKACCRALQAAGECDEILTLISQFQTRRTRGTTPTAAGSAQHEGGMPPIEDAQQHHPTMTVPCPVRDVNGSQPSLNQAGFPSDPYQSMKMHCGEDGRSPTEQSMRYGGGSTGGVDVKTEGMTSHGEDVHPEHQEATHSETAPDLLPATNDHSPQAAVASPDYSQDTGLDATTGRLHSHEENVAGQEDSSDQQHSSRPPIPLAG